MMLKHALPLLALIAAAPGAAQQNQAIIEPAQVVSAAQVCIAAYDEKKFEFSERKFKTLGWTRARFDDPLTDIAKAWVRPDGALTITLQTVCALKVRMTADGLSALPEAFSGTEGFEAASAGGSDPKWTVGRWSVELHAGPADGSNVSVEVERGF